MISQFSMESRPGTYPIRSKKRTWTLLMPTSETVLVKKVRVTFFFAYFIISSDVHATWNKLSQSRMVLPYLLHVEFSIVESNNNKIECISEFYHIIRQNRQRQVHPSERAWLNFVSVDKYPKTGTSSRRHCSGRSCHTNVWSGKVR
jgi:hypothetical protein